MIKGITMWEKICKKTKKIIDAMSWYAALARLLFVSLFVRKPEKITCIIGAARSGTTLLGTYLGSCKDVFYGHEVLNPAGREGLCFHIEYILFLPKWLIRRIALLYLTLIVKTMSRDQMCVIKLVHYQLHTCHIFLPDLRRIFPNVRFLIIYRRSVLEQFTSLCVAQKTAQWRKTSDMPYAEFVGRITIDTRRMMNHYMKNEDFYKSMLAIPWISMYAVVLTYEELRERPQQIFNDKIFPFLSLPKQPIETYLLKQNVRPLSDVIENFHEAHDCVMSHQLFHSFNVTSRESDSENVI